MPTQLLITAEPKTGKTTLMKKIVSAIGHDRMGGFYTEEIRENDKRTGFLIKTLDGNEGILASIDSTSDVRIGKWGVNIDDFERVALPSLVSALNDREIIVLDEIGPMEICSAKFRVLLEKILKSNKTLIGTIFSDSHDWIDALKQNFSGEIIRLTMENRDTILEEILGKIG